MPSDISGYSDAERSARFSQMEPFLRGRAHRREDDQPVILTIRQLARFQYILQPALNTRSDGQDSPSADSDQPVTS